MSRVVWKFTVPVTDRATVVMDAQLLKWLHVESAGPDMLTVWALVRPAADGKARRYVLHVHGTGHRLSERAGRHVGSVSWHGIKTTDLLAGPVGEPIVFVWHVFAENGTELEIGAAA
ncbi:DUF7352 domain-containing protein [Tsukamurella sp. USMM236]|uniref:DUF7352 domain-containing protein n=1 Tax=Tsukamurella sp. USMM236 TaxID=3081301 RepID=UPI003019F1A7